MLKGRGVLRSRFGTQDRNGLRRSARIPATDRVYMFVRNPCTHDARVLKEAGTLAEIGYRVTVIALLRPELAEREVREGFEIMRVPVNPIHYRILRCCRHFIYRVAVVSKPLRVHLVSVVSLSVRLRDALFALLPFDRSPREVARSRLRALRVALLAHVRGVARGLRGASYRLLREFLFIAHEPLLLRDYTLRSLAVVREDPAVVYHAHDLNTLVPAVLAARKTASRVVYDSHELNLDAGTTSRVLWFKRAFLCRLERSLIARSDRIITVNESIARMLAERYGIDTPAVMMNCPRPMRAAGDGILRRKLGIDADRALVLYHGGLTPERGLPELVTAMQQVNHGTMLAFMGYGSLRPTLELLVGELELTERVRFLEVVPQDELLAHSSSADVGVIPYQNTTLNNYYATPNKLFEYLMAGVPVVASNFPEMARIIVGHEVGAVFDPVDPGDIARAIDEVLANPALPEMRERARTISRARYSWSVESRVLTRIYGELAPAG